MPYAFVDAYPDPAEQDATPAAHLDELDAGIYRRILSRVAVAGLPDFVQIGDVRVSFVVGPVRTQVTELRQRPGLPFAFDKHMQRATPVGAGMLLTVVELPVSVTDGIVLAPWRDRVDAALGYLICQLDERVVGRELGEDVLLLRQGSVVTAADEVSRVRSFMPFEVTAQDRLALDHLATVDLDTPGGVTRAAALYAAASREGPSQLGFLLMWLAVDAVAYERKNQVRAVRQALRKAGFQEPWLDSSVGRLADLRGKVAHGRSSDGEDVFAAYYEIESIARCLIRSAGALQQAWPLSPTILAFRPAVAGELGPASKSYETHWHDEGLPDQSSDDPTPLMLDRYDAVAGGHASWVHVTGADDKTAARVRWACWHAVRAIEIDISDISIAVAQEAPPSPGAETATAANAPQVATSTEQVVLAHGLLALAVASDAAWKDQAGRAVIVTLSEALVQQQVMRLGILTDSGAGTFLIALAGGWSTAHYFGLALSPDALTNPRNDEPEVIGQLTGAAVAGHDAHVAAVCAWEDDPASPSDAVQLVKSARVALAGIASTRDLLERLDQAVVR